MADILNIPLFLDTLRNNDKYREELTKIVPAIKDDIASFYTNPHCNCKKNIYNYIENNKNDSDIRGFIAVWKEIIPNLMMDVKIPENVQTTPTRNNIVNVQSVNEDNAPKIKSMTGHVVEIPGNPLEYKNLIDHATKNNWVYRGISITEKTVDGETIWLVFFY
jgi:hypothetical protein